MSNDVEVNSPSPRDRQLSPPASTKPGSTRDTGFALPVYVALWTLVAVISVGLLFVDMSTELVGSLVIAQTLAIMLAGLPIGIAMLVSSLLGLWVIGGEGAVASTFETHIFDSVASWQFSVIPMFILMGLLMWRAGLTAKAFESARQWLGKLPGGLAIASNFAGAGLAAGSGSTIGISYALGRIAIPEMLKRNYSPQLATGVVTMAGTLGQIIPPSLLLVVYAGIVQTPVGPQLLAGIVPGLLLAVGFGLMIWVRATIRPSIAPRDPLIGVTWRTRFRSLMDMVPVIAVVLVVVGGLFFGVFTATEAGAFGVLAAFVFGWLSGGKGNRSPKAVARMVGPSIAQALTASAGVFLLIIGTLALTRVLALSGLATALTEIVIAADLPRISLLLALVVVYLLLGLVLDALPLMLLTIPILVGPLEAVGVDMLWYGVFIVILAEIAIVTPPIGMLTFIIHKLVQDKDVNLGTTIRLTDVFKGVLWFLCVALVLVILIILIPEIVTWLPGVANT